MYIFGSTFLVGLLKNLDVKNIKKNGKSYAKNIPNSLPLDGILIFLKKKKTRA